MDGRRSKIEHSDVKPKPISATHRTTKKQTKTGGVIECPGNRLSLCSELAVRFREYILALL